MRVWSITGRNAGERKSRARGLHSRFVIYNQVNKQCLSWFIPSLIPQGCLAGPWTLAFRLGPH